MFYKPCPDQYIEDWISNHNYNENSDQEMKSMRINLHTLSKAVNGLACTSIEDIRTAMSEDAELQMLQTHIVKGWPQN